MSYDDGVAAVGAVAGAGVVAVAGAGVAAAFAGFRSKIPAN